jgi:hypothetical protein
MRRQRWALGLVRITLLAALVALSGALPQASVLAFQDGPRAELRRQTDEAEQRWQASGITSYEIVVRLHTAWVLRWYRVVVRDGQIAETSARCERSLPGFEQCQFDPSEYAKYSVPGLFTIARELLTSKPTTKIGLRFDDRDGHAIELSSDIPEYADDEVFIAVESLKPTPDGAPPARTRLGPGDPPAVGEVIFEDPLTAPGALPRPFACPSGRNSGAFVAEGYLLKVTGRCTPEATDATLNLPPIPDLTVVDGEISVEAKAVSGHDRLSIAVWFRSNEDTSQGNAVILVPTAGIMMLFKVMPDAATTLAARNDLKGRISRDDWNTVAIRLDGASMWILLNGQPVFAASDSQTDRGGVSLGANRFGNRDDNAESAAVFRNLRVSRLAASQ